MAGTPVLCQQGSTGLPLRGRHWAKRPADNIWLRGRQTNTTTTATTPQSDDWDFDLNYGFGNDVKVDRSSFRLAAGRGN